MRSIVELRQAGFADLVAALVQQIYQFRRSGSEFALHHRGREDMMFVDLELIRNIIRDYAPEERRKVFQELSPEERRDLLRDLPIEERLADLPPAERLQGLPRKNWWLVSVRNNGTASSDCQSIEASGSPRVPREVSPMPQPSSSVPPDQSPGPIIFSGRTILSNSSPLRKPSATHASRRVVPSVCAFLATLAALS